METTDLAGEEPLFEEINGVRYALWTAQSEPLGMGQWFTWRQFAVFLAGIAAFLAAMFFSILFGIFGGWSLTACLVPPITIYLALLTALIAWSFRKRRAMETTRFRKWREREPDVEGVPGAVWTAYGLTRCVDHGLICVKGPWLVFRGPRFTLRFLASDLKQGGRKGELRFAYGSPFGKRAIRLVFGGPSPSGWTKKKDARQSIAPELETWRGSKAEGKSIYPPLRNPEVRFEPGFLAATVPLMLAAYAALFYALAAAEILLRWLFGRGSLTDLAVAAGLFVVGFYGLYGLAIACGYGARAVMRARNRRIDGLVAAERGLG